MYCERIRWDFWLEWHVFRDSFCSDDVSEDSGDPFELLDFGLFSPTETSEEEVTVSSLACSLMADTDCSDPTPFHSDTNMDASGQEQEEC
ncbi:failed axon connections homolog [Anguilla anguilla]|uniref:failed axon connections homolog n=1 Tax=Anguilla anguilla TaxID=7936 RepID=UPI0015B1AC46|nr:failed axon connections homolog [Anguilla anguilla]